MKCLYYGLIMLLSWGILNAQEEPIKKVPDLDSTIKNVIGLLDVSNNTTKFVDNKPNNSDTLVQAAKLAATEYPQKSIELILWNHCTEFPKLQKPFFWAGYRTTKFKENPDFSNKKNDFKVVNKVN